VKILEEIKNLIPPLTKEEYNGLKKSLQNEGCLDSLRVWHQEDVLIDGHHRLRICEELGIEYETMELDFDSLDEVKIWVIQNQFHRRNLSTYQKGLLALQLKPLFAARAKERQIRKPNSVLVNSPKQNPINTREEIAKAADLSDSTIKEIEYIEKHAAPEDKQKLLKREVSVHKVFTETKKAKNREQIKEKIAEQKPQAPNFYTELPKKKYRVLYADPPWHHANKALGSSPEDHYLTMTTEDICAMNIKAITEKNAVLFLWSTSPHLKEALEVVSSWGFVYKSTFVWDKIKHVMGHYNSIRHEILLICTRGSCTPDVKILYDSVQSIEKGAHSEKPENFRKIIDTLYPLGKRIELFAKKSTKNWDAFGNEIKNDKQ